MNDELTAKLRHAYANNEIPELPTNDWDAQLFLWARRWTEGNNPEFLTWITHLANEGPWDD